MTWRIGWPADLSFLLFSTDCVWGLICGWGRSFYAAARALGWERTRHPSRSATRPCSHALCDCWRRLPQPIVVVTAAGQVHQTLPATCRFAADERPERGPLEGLAAGLRAIGGDADAVYATSCDVPLLVPAFVMALADRLGKHDIDRFQVAVPWDGKYHHPLSAIYRIGVLTKIDELLAVDRLRPTELFDLVLTNRVPTDELRRRPDARNAPQSQPARRLSHRTQRRRIRAAARHTYQSATRIPHRAE